MANSGNIPARCTQADPRQHSRWIHSRCRVFAASRAGPGRLECQTHYYRWNWKWPCLPDLEKWQQHRQDPCTTSWWQMWDTMAKYWYWGHGCVYTLSCNYNTSHAVWNTGACCQKGDAHDDIRDSQSEADDSHLNRRLVGHIFTSLF